MKMTSRLGVYLGHFEFHIFSSESFLYTSHVLCVSPFLFILLLYSRFLH